MKLVKDVSDTPGKYQERQDGKDHPEDIRNQMSLISDTDEILKFLELAGNRSILNEHTINCRLTACHNLFPILNTGEDNVNFMLRNLDLLVNRFRNKNSAVQASTLKVYKSRLKSTLEDFVAWSKDSEAWERSVLEKVSQASREKKAKAAPATPVTKGKNPVTSSQTSSVVTRPSGDGMRKLCFPLRSDINIEITIPAEGLSAKDLVKLNLFLYPYCKDMDTQEPWQLPH